MEGKDGKDSYQIQPVEFESADEMPIYPGSQDTCYCTVAHKTVSGAAWYDVTAWSLFFSPAGK
jgi:hypothetical protein